MADSFMNSSCWVWLADTTTNSSQSSSQWMHHSTKKIGLVDTYANYNFWVCRCIHWPEKKGSSCLHSTDLYCIYKPLRKEQGSRESGSICWSLLEKKPGGLCTNRYRIHPVCTFKYSEKKSRQWITTKLYQQCVSS